MLLEPLNGTFWVGCIYGRNDDASRFAYFCGAATDYLRIANIQCVFSSINPALRCVRTSAEAWVGLKHSGGHNRQRHA